MSNDTLDVEVSSCPVQGNASLQKLLGRCRGQRSRGTVQWSIRHLHQMPWFGCAQKKTAGAADENQNKNVITNENSQFSSPTLCLKPDDDAYIWVCFFHRPWLVPQIPAGSSRLLARSIYLKQYDKWKIARWIETIQNLGRIWPQICLCFLIVCNWLESYDYWGSMNLNHAYILGPYKWICTPFSLLVQKCSWIWAWWQSSQDQTHYDLQVTGCYTYIYIYSDI